MDTKDPNDKKDKDKDVNGRRKVLIVAIATIISESGFKSIEKEALEILTEILQCFITSVGASGRMFCEHANRTDPVIADVIMALGSMGISWQGIDLYSKRDPRHVVSAPHLGTFTKNPIILQAGTKSSHPGHIPSHLPPLPDPHSYIRTPTHKQPVTEYEAIREKSANQKKDIERALTKFLAKTGDTHSLFDNDDRSMFPLIACKPVFPTYLSALMPTDQVFDFEELEYHYQVANRTEDIPDSKQDDENEETNDADKKDEETTEASASNQNLIDNPYLQAAKIPKKVKQDTS